MIWKAKVKESNPPETIAPRSKSMQELLTEQWRDKGLASAIRGSCWHLGKLHGTKALHLSWRGGEVRP